MRTSLSLGKLVSLLVTAWQLWKCSVSARTVGCCEIDAQNVLIQCTNCSDPTLDLSQLGLSAIKSGAFQHAGASLSILNLKQNQLRRLPDDVFAGLTALDTVVLRENLLEELPSTIFQRVKQLKGIDLSFNGLSNIPEDLFKGLESMISIVIMGNTKLEKLAENTFQDQTQLFILNIENNSLSSLPSKLFSAIGTTKALLIDDNNLTMLPKDIFSNMHALELLFLTGNPGVTPENCPSGSDYVEICHNPQRFFCASPDSSLLHDLS